MMRLHSRYIRFLGLVLLTILLVLLLIYSQAPDSGTIDAEERPGWPEPAHDAQLDELLDESFTRPPEPNGPSFRVDVGRLPAGVVNFGIVERRQSPLCPEKTLYSPVSGRVRSFQSITGGGDQSSPLFLYSGTMELQMNPTDPTIPGNLHISVTAFVERGFRAGLFCQVWYRDGLRPLSLLPAHIRLLPETTSKESTTVYQAALLRCVESDVWPSDSAPYAVSLVPALSMCTVPSNVLPLTRPHSGWGATQQQTKQQTGLAVCCPSPLGSDTDAVWLIEWLEAQRLFGARRVFLYLMRGDDAPLPTVFRVLRAFPTLLTLLDWPLPSVEMQDDINKASFFRRGRTLAANDCLRRAAAAHFSRVLISDSHKLLVPGARHADWLALIRVVEGSGSRTPAAFLLHAARTQPATGEERDLLGGSPLKLSVRQRATELGPAGADMNLLVDPSRVRSVGGDGSLEFVVFNTVSAAGDVQTESETTVTVSEDDALVFEYELALGAESNAETDTVIDERLAPFTFQLIAAVKATQLDIRRN